MTNAPNPFLQALREQQGWIGLGERARALRDQAQQLRRGLGQRKTLQERFASSLSEGLLALEEGLRSHPSDMWLLDFSLDQTTALLSRNEDRAAAQVAEKALLYSSPPPPTRLVDLYTVAQALVAADANHLADAARAMARLHDRIDMPASVRERLRAAMERTYRNLLFNPSGGDGTFPDDQLVSLEAAYQRTFPAEANSLAPLRAEYQRWRASVGRQQFELKLNAAVAARGQGQFDQANTFAQDAEALLRALQPLDAAVPARNGEPSLAELGARLAKERSETQSARLLQQLAQARDKVAVVLNGEPTRQSLVEAYNIYNAVALEAERASLKPVRAQASKQIEALGVFIRDLDSYTGPLKAARSLAAAAPLFEATQRLGIARELQKRHGELSALTSPLVSEEPIPLQDIQTRAGQIEREALAALSSTALDEAQIKRVRAQFAPSLSLSDADRALLSSEVRAALARPEQTEQPAPTAGGGAAGWLTAVQLALLALAVLASVAALAVALIGLRGGQQTIAAIARISTVVALPSATASRPVVLATQAPAATPLPTAQPTETVAPSATNAPPNAPDAGAAATAVPPPSDAGGIQLEESVRTAFQNPLFDLPLVITGTAKAGEALQLSVVSGTNPALAQGTVTANLTGMWVWNTLTALPAPLTAGDYVLRVTPQGGQEPLLTQMFTVIPVVSTTVAASQDLATLYARPGGKERQQLSPNTPIEVVGMSEDQKWYAVRIPGKRELFWCEASQVAQLSADQLQSVPVVNPDM